MVQGAETKALRIVKKSLFQKRPRNQCSKEGSETNVLKSDWRPSCRQRLRNLCPQTVQKPAFQKRVRIQCSTNRPETHVPKKVQKALVQTRSKNQGSTKNWNHWFMKGSATDASKKDRKPMFQRRLKRQGFKKVQKPQLQRRFRNCWFERREDHQRKYGEWWSKEGPKKVQRLMVQRRFWIQGCQQGSETNVEKKTQQPTFQQQCRDQRHTQGF